MGVKSVGKKRKKEKKDEYDFVAPLPKQRKDCDFNFDVKVLLRVVEIASLLGQEKNDCSVFVAAFAEFFIHEKDVPLDFDIKAYRTRLEKNIDSEYEKPNKSMKNVQGKNKSLVIGD
uniref:Uncharacterized protein n=1 Tax=Cannabis sativa TaxID=3483 RepID=A0A803P694_CANSA